MNDELYCGFIAIIGKPNVGKSTLINKLIGEKISITSNRPQTTRHKILGIKTIANKQAIYIDTPGLSGKSSSKLNKLMNKAARSSLKDVDLIMFVIECLHWNSQDEMVLREINKLKTPPPVFLILNKFDIVPDQKLLFPEIKQLTQRYNFSEVFPVSSKKDINIELLEQHIFNILPKAPHYFFNTSVTDRDLNFRFSEIIREKLIRNLGQELPYILHVEIARANKAKEIYNIDAIIWVEKLGQKKIVIGAKGDKLKIIATKARLELEKLLKTKVFLTVLVQVKPNWTDSSNKLKNLNIE